METKKLTELEKLLLEQYRECNNSNVENNRLGNWLAEKCMDCKQPETIDYYKSLGLSLRDVLIIFYSCNYARTPEMLEYYKSLNTSKKDVSWLMNHYKFTSG